MQHPDDDTILRYVSDEVSDAEQQAVDAHLADCSRCLEQVRALSYLRENFDRVWTSWTAAEHGRAYRQWRLARALGQVTQASPSLSEKAEQWLQRLEDGADVTLNVLMDTDRRIACAAEGALPEGYAFELSPAAAGVGAADELAQVEDHLKRAEELMAAHSFDAAIEELRKAASIDARSPQAATSQVYREGRRVLQVVADSRRGRLSVKYWAEAGETAPALALLLPDDPEACTSAAEFQPVEGEDYLLAEFENLPSGVFRIQIGPFVASE